MSDVQKAGAASPAAGPSEYDLMMELSNELERMTGEVLDLRARNARLASRLRKAEAAADEARASLKASAARSAAPLHASPSPAAPAAPAVPASPPAPVACGEDDWGESPASRGAVLRVFSILAAIMLVVTVGVIASIVTFSLLYDMELIEAARALAEGVATLIG